MYLQRSKKKVHGHKKSLRSTIGRYFPKARTQTPQDPKFASTTRNAGATPPKSYLNSGSGYQISKIMSSEGL